MTSFSLYIDMSKAGPKMDLPNKPGALPPGRSSSDYDYQGGAKAPSDGRNWESTGGTGGGWRALKTDKGTPSAESTDEPQGKPSLEDRQIPKDPNKNLSSAPGVESKQSILSGKPEDFKDHSVSDHYKIMHEVSHDKKLWKQHYDMANEKSSKMTSSEHQQVSEDMRQAHVNFGHDLFGVAADKHAAKAEETSTAAEKTKADVGVDAGQKDLGRQVSRAKLDDSKEKLTIEEDGPKGYGTDDYATHEEAVAAHKKDLESLKAEHEKTVQKHKDFADKAKFDEPAPKAADFPEGKVPPEAKRAYESRKKNAQYQQEISKQMVEEAKESHKAKTKEHSATKPQAKEWKAKDKEEQTAAAEEQAMQDATPKAPTTDMERAEVSGHTNKAKELLDNINSHLDSGALDEGQTKHLTSVRDALERHQDLTTVPSKDQKSELKQATALASEHGKKPHEGEAEAKKPQQRSTGGGGSLMGAFQSGRVAGEQVGEAAGSPEGGGALGGAVISYAAQGAVGAGHFLLNKDEKFEKKPKATNPAKPSREART